MAQSHGVRGSYPRAVSLGMGVPTGTVSGQEAVTVGSGQAGQPRRGREGDSNGGGSTFRMTPCPPLRAKVKN